MTVFLSTLSLRRATCTIRQSHCNHQISIHALLAESDGAAPGCISVRSISIHALLAESDFGTACATPYFFQFLSTLSLRRATITNIQRNGNTDISIHALLAESDTHIQKWVCIRFYFYPRSPCGERLSSWTFSTFTNRISIHALLAESDRISLDGVGVILISIHALLAESDAATRRMISAAVAFLSTLSLRRAT